MRVFEKSTVEFYANLGRVITKSGKGVTKDDRGFGCTYHGCHGCMISSIISTLISADYVNL